MVSRSPVWVELGLEDECLPVGVLGRVDDPPTVDGITDDVGVREGSSEGVDDVGAGPDTQRQHHSVCWDCHDLTAGDGLEVHAVIRDTCLLYTSDAADDLLCVDLGGRRIIKKK